jgi:hypothetical protein
MDKLQKENAILSSSPEQKSAFNQTIDISPSSNEDDTWFGV